MQLFFVRDVHGGCPEGDLLQHFGFLFRESILSSGLSQEGGYAGFFCSSAVALIFPGDHLLHFGSDVIDALLYRSLAFQGDIAFREFQQSLFRRTITFPRSDLFLLADGQLSQECRIRSEAEFVVEPEDAGLNTFRIGVDWTTFRMK